MTGRRRLIPSLVVAVLVLLTASAVALVAAGGRSQTRQPRRQTSGPRTSLSGDRQIGRLVHGTVRFALNLRLHERALDEYLRHVDPRTGGRGRLTAAAFGGRFGPSDADMAKLRAALGRLGISVDHVYPQRTAMLARASVSQLEHVFALRFDRYRMPDGRRYFSPEQPPRIP